MSDSQKTFSFNDQSENVNPWKKFDPLSNPKLVIDSANQCLREQAASYRKHILRMIEAGILPQKEMKAFDESPESWSKKIEERTEAE